MVVPTARLPARPRRPTSPVSGDVGNTLKVRASFTDGAGHDEMRTSDPTAAVAAEGNNPATGQPTISGTAQVGETLTAGRQRDHR